MVVELILHPVVELIIDYLYIHSLRNNNIKAEGGVAISEALRGMINLQYLE